MNIKRAELFGKTMGERTGKRMGTMGPGIPQYSPDLPSVNSDGYKVWKDTQDRLDFANGGASGAPNNPMDISPGYVLRETPYSSVGNRRSIVSDDLANNRKFDAGAHSSFIAGNPRIPSYRHPSGSIQTGGVIFDYGPGKGIRYGALTSPGADSGRGVHRFDLHGGDTGGGSRYALSNPYHSDFMPSRDLPRMANPSTVISGACNGGVCGTPAAYAKFFNENYRRSPESVGSQLNLRKVVMTPPGYIGRGNVSMAEGYDHTMQTGTLADPYIWKKFNDNPANKPYQNYGPSSAAHEYWLKKDGNPLEERDWVDTGIYSDARQAANPFSKKTFEDEVQEISRHVGLPPEFGGGGFRSYLDKIDRINSNPDASPSQLIYSNMARPMGAPAAWVRKIIPGPVNLAADVADAYRGLAAAASKRPAPSAIDMATNLRPGINFNYRPRR